jgi:hypothetical protein
VIRKTMLRFSSIILLIFNGIAACFGGYILVSDPSGRTMQISLDFLKHSPFHDYLIPGLILLVALGGGSVITALMAIAKSRSYPIAVSFMGCVLIIWIVVQMVMLQVLFYLQFVIGGIGILLLVMGMIQWRALRTHAGF